MSTARLITRVRGLCLADVAINLGELNGSALRAFIRKERAIRVKFVLVHTSVAVRVGLHRFLRDIIFTAHQKRGDHKQRKHAEDRRTFTATPFMRMEGERDLIHRFQRL